MKNKGGLMELMLSVLGIVLYISMFTTILDGLVTLVLTSGFSSYTILSTVVKLSPVVLMVSIPAFLAYTSFKGYQGVAGNDPGGFMRIILGSLWIVLFVSMFSTILTNFDSVRTYTNSTCATYTVSYFTALSTVVVVMPTIIFLGGIFSGGLMAVGGGRARWAHRRHSMA